MANLLGMIVTWITFPGVILHEWSHKFFCDRAGIPVYEVKYFSFGNPAGYVRHGEITRYRDAFLTTIAPFIINTIFALIMFIIPILNINSIVNLFFIWLGVSFAMHAFPSDGDGKNLWAYSKRVWRGNPIALIGFPIVGIIIIANLLRIFWFDLIYAGFLFGITFGIVGFAFSVGSVADFGSSSHNTMYPTAIPSNNVAPTKATATTTQTITGQETAAKDWLSIAQNAMSKENSNAFLISVHGWSADRKVVLPINGKCHWWTYNFVSPSEKLVYDVSVHDGRLERVNKRVGFTDYSMESILCKNDNPRVDPWTLDSVDVVTIANEKYKELNGQELPYSAGYTLEVSPDPANKGKLTWYVCYYDSSSKVIGNIMIDYNTSAVVST